MSPTIVLNTFKKLEQTSSIEPKIKGESFSLYVDAINYKEVIWQISKEESQKEFKDIPGEKSTSLKRFSSQQENNRCFRAKFTLKNNFNEFSKPVRR